MRKMMIAATVLATLNIILPVSAETTPAVLDLRVGKLEKEMTAVQRKIWPQGTPVQPELGADATPVADIGSPASAPVSDLTARVDSIEKSLATLTGQVEQNGFRIRQQDEAIKRLEARLNPADAAITPVAPAAPKPTALVPTPAKSIAKPPAVTPTKIDPARKAAIAAIELPATGDAAEDAYTYGYRLYAAKFYPEAEAKLKEFVAKYSSHKRASYAQNLLGRAYLDEGKPKLASGAFYDNYQKMPKGERAPESLYWLGQALVKLSRTTDACKVYDELRDVYGTQMPGELKAKAVKARADAKCPA